MTLLIDENDIAGLVTMDDALVAVEEVFAAVGRGEALNVPRLRFPIKSGIVRITAGVLSYRGYYGIKMSSTAVFGSHAGRLFCLYEEESGRLCAVIQVFRMGALRTGAASGIATKFMADPKASVLAIIGSGRQARTQVEAICRVRPIQEVRVFSRSDSNRRSFCNDLAQSISAQFVPVGSAEEAVKGAHIVVTATSAEKPVLEGNWLSPGAHVNAIGANYEHRRELDADVVRRAKLIATDDLEQVRYEATDLVEPAATGVLKWEDVKGLGQIVVGGPVARPAGDGVTLFKSLGVAIEDVAMAIGVYERARAQGLGTRIPDIAG